MARNGLEKWKEIIDLTVALPEPDRRRVMTQMMVFSGLRPMPEQFKMEMEKMRTNYDIEKHPLLGPIYQEVKAEGKAEGLAEGMAAGQAKGEATAKVQTLLTLLEGKFGKPLPRWAAKRIKDAKPTQHDKWLLLLLKSDTLEGVIGKRVTATRKR